MFASSTSSPGETFDGCPVVYLFDSPYDLAHLLRVLLPTLQITYRPTQEDPLRTFDEVSAVIRLAHKYHIPQIQKQALSSLRDYHFTSSFSVFSNPTPRELEIVADPAHAICAVNLARLTDTPSMLPLALYRCAYLGDALLDGWTRADGTVERLSDVDLRQCLAARVALANERFFLISRILDATRIIPRCRNPSRCRMSLHSVHARAMSRKVMRAEEKEVVDGGGVLRDWQPLIGKLTNGKSLCGQCLEELAKRSVNERRSVWNRLPEILGIQVGDWGEPEVVAETGPDTVDTEEDSSDDLF